MRPFLAAPGWRLALFGSGLLALASGGESAARLATGDPVARAFLREQLARLYLAGGLSWAVLVFLGWRRACEALRRLLAPAPQALRAATAGTAVAVALPVLAWPGLDAPGLTSYLACLGTSTVFFLALLALLGHWEPASRWVAGLAERYSVPGLAALFLVLAALAALTVLDDMPHTSDEVAYQFQARTFLQGRLWLDPPPVPESFAFVHTLVDGPRWYGIMSPGWPLLLAPGHVAGLPWLVNPLLGALALLAAWRYFRAAGASRLETRIALLLLALSPLCFFLSATYLAHAANLALFMLFAWWWVRLVETARLRYALGAGLALGMNLLVRPPDTVAAALPFLFYGLVRSRRSRAALLGIAVSLALAGGFAVLLLLYHRALTGDPFLLPMVKYFRVKGLGEFGLGFGAHMGTRLHGPEWPGYWPSDAIRVTSHRLVQFLQDFGALPLGILAFVVFVVFLVSRGSRAAALRRSPRDVPPWHAVLVASGLCIFGLYACHFYHGIAFGARHYALALPALAALIAGRGARWLRSPEPALARAARVALAALLVHTALFAYPGLLVRYGSWYRGVSPAAREEVGARRLEGALVLVDPANWAWKSTFPLNEYPLEKNPVVFARHRDETTDREVLAAFPGRKGFSLRLERGGRVVHLEPLAALPDRASRAGGEPAVGPGAVGKPPGGAGPERPALPGTAAPVVPGPAVPAAPDPPASAMPAAAGRAAGRGAP